MGDIHYQNETPKELSIGDIISLIEKLDEALSLIVKDSYTEKRAEMKEKLNDIIRYYTEIRDAANGKGNINIFILLE